MEIKKNRYGQDRSYERVDEKRIRVRGNSKYQRESADDNGNITMFDFEGGPCFNLHGKIKFKYKRNILSLAISKNPFLLLLI